MADLKLVMPELWLVVTMCLVLIVPFIRKGNVVLPVFVTIFGLMMALLAAQGVHLDSFESLRQGLVFSNSLAIDPFSSLFKTLLMVFAILVVAQWTIFGRDKTHALDAPDFLCLLLGATFGMSLMASANNLIMIFIATESASIPSYALAGFRKKNKMATEGSLNALAQNVRTTMPKYHFSKFIIKCQQAQGTITFQRASQIVKFPLNILITHHFIHIVVHLNFAYNLGGISFASVRNLCNGALLRKAVRY